MSDSDPTDDVEQFLDPKDHSAAGQDMAADNEPKEGEEGTSGLPPEGDDPMDGAAPSS